MIRTLTLATFAAAVLAAPACAASFTPPQGQPRLDLNQMMGRWYEVARVPNSLQNGCAAGASEWRPTPQGFAVVQSCHKGSPSGPVKEWRAKATVADPATNARFKMSFFGGLVSQDYRVLAHDAAQGWLVMATADGKYLWLFSQQPTLPALIRAQAISRIRAMGFDTGRLEFPAPSGD
jgi:apolipoprotein D and lipocalin family protein